MRVRIVGIHASQCFIRAGKAHAIGEEVNYELSPGILVKLVVYSKLQSERVGRLQNGVSVRQGLQSSKIQIRIRCKQVYTSRLLLIARRLSLFLGSTSAAS